MLCCRFMRSPRVGDASPAPGISSYEPSVTDMNTAIRRHVGACKLRVINTGREGHIGNTAESTGSCGHGSTTSNQRGVTAVTAVTAVATITGIGLGVATRAAAAATVAAIAG